MKTTTVTTWNPYREFDALAQRLWGYSPVSGRAEGCASPARQYAPPVDVAETPTSFLLTLDLPGVDKSGLKVTVENQVLVIQGERKAPELAEGAKSLIAERSYGTFQRSFKLPEEADGAAVSASYKEGVLTVTLPKQEERQPKQITVSVES